MYEEKKYNINWLGLIGKILLFVAIVLFILWIFPKNNKAYDEALFANNLNNIKEAAKSYYTVDRLPKNIGDSLTLTLKEMIDNKMVLTPVDKKGKTCNINSSYVTITKTESDKYILKTYLECGDKTDYIEETIGCYNVCTNGVCTQEVETIEKDDTESVLKYQFRRLKTSGSDSYACPSGYSLNNGKCSKVITSSVVNATKVYDEAKVEVIDAAKYTTPSKLTCPSGYSLKGTQCIKYKTATTSASYTCPSGYTLSGTKCNKTTSSVDSINATAHTGATTYTCPSGYTLSGTKCNKTVTSSSSINATAKTSYGAWYVYTTYKVTTPKTTYVNATSKLVGTGTSKGYTCSVIINCPTQVTYYNYTLYKRKATTTYSCPSGYTLSGTKCNKTTSSVDSINATAHTGATTYSCPSGYTLSGTKCNKTVSSSSSINATLSCPSGYSQSGSSCSKQTTSTIKANMILGDTIYSCPLGYDISGTKCKITKDAELIDYTCPTGYVRNGSKCYLTSEETAEMIKTTSSSSYYEYTWSTNKTLAGWEYTGVTKQLKK